MLIINPGADIGTQKEGWTNTVKLARLMAEQWLRSMRDDGITDVELLDGEPAYENGRWTFVFRHKVTGVEVELETHGIDDLDPYREEYVFTPRIYWNGSSCSSPGLDDFEAPGFHKRCTWVADGSEK